MLNYAEIGIKTYALKDGFRRFELKSNELVEKRRDLRFEANTNASQPYQIYWQVTNTGSEAQQARCLRGEFYDCIIEQGKLIRKETTSYTGKHLVECFVVKNGVCVGKSGEFIVNVK